jgi:hypothetical protein
MKDRQLRDLNFVELLHYGGQPPVQYRYRPNLHCDGYCVACEEKGIVDRSRGALGLMSHGCDSADFEQVLGPMPRIGVGVEQPVLFLLEDPGGCYGNEELIEFRGHKKKPPVNHYYWTPETASWPRESAEFNGNFYGPYFAYLMQRHQLLNVYITNLVKCKWTAADKTDKSKTPADISAYCAEHFLRRELAFFAPSLVFLLRRCRSERTSITKGELSINVLVAPSRQTIQGRTH